MTTDEIVRALRELEAENQCLCMCDECHEGDCLTPLFRSAANLIEQLTAENADLRKEVEWKGMVIALAQRKQAEAEAERDALLGEIRKSGCTYCKHAAACVDELSAFGQEDCDRCGSLRPHDRSCLPGAADCVDGGQGRRKPAVLSGGVWRFGSRHAPSWGAAKE